LSTSIAVIARLVAIAHMDRAIQYGAAFRFCHWRLWNTGSPACAGDDTEQAEEANPVILREPQSGVAKGRRPPQGDGEGVDPVGSIPATNSEYWNSNAELPDVSSGLIEPCAALPGLLCMGLFLDILAARPATVRKREKRRESAAPAARHATPNDTPRNARCCPRAAPALIVCSVLRRSGTGCGSGSLRAGSSGSARRP
jgi:hypothetical protein